MMSSRTKLKSGIVINGPRPSPLSIKQESHTIHKHQNQIRKPVIIYIHSPKIIHTKPHEFMALVQKLTGQQQQRKKKNKKKTLKQDGYDLNVSNDSGVTHDHDHEGMKSKSPMFKMPSNPYVADVPLFTPNTSDLFFSPQRFLSPGSIVELLKELPEY